MFTKSVAALAIVGSAAAYVPPMMSLSANRREAVAGAAAAAVVAPMAANAKIVTGLNIKAPIIELFDSRGCEVKKNNYSGPKSNGDEDEQCIKLTMEAIPVSESTAQKFRNEFLSFTGKAIDGEFIAGKVRKY